MPFPAAANLASIPMPRNATEGVPYSWSLPVLFVKKHQWITDFVTLTTAHEAAVSRQHFLHHAGGVHSRQPVFQSIPQIEKLLVMQS